jgi:hypothetical protein
VDVGPLLSAMRQVPPQRPHARPTTQLHKLMVHSPFHRGTAAGTPMGVALAESVKLWMVNGVAMQRMHFGAPLVCLLFVLVLGQVAVLWLALKEASILWLCQPLSEQM